MDLLRNVVVLLHIIGFAITFGAWVTSAVSREFRVTRVMDYGLLLSLITGIALAAPWPAGIELNYPKLGLKLALLIILGGVRHGERASAQDRPGRAAPVVLRGRCPVGDDGRRRSHVVSRSVRSRSMVAG